MNVSVIPYLAFNGDCKEAVDRYIRVFGGKVKYISYWGKENCDDPSRWGKVMHAEFDLGSTQMDASDPPFRVINDGAVRLMIRLDSKEEVLKAVETLSEGGTVITSLSPKESRYLLPDQLRLYRSIAEHV